MTPEICLFKLRFNWITYFIFDRFQNTDYKGQYSNCNNQMKERKREEEIIVNTVLLRFRLHTVD